MPKSFALQAIDLGIRVDLDQSDHSLGKKIQRAELEKIPCLLVIGKKELETAQTTPRLRDDLKSGQPEKSYKINDIFQILSKEIKTKAFKSQL